MKRMAKKTKKIIFVDWTKMDRNYSVAVPDPGSGAF
jgi:hypothetical protein